MQFRSVFKLNRKLEKWYPGHMFSGMRAMEKNLKAVDCIIEVHDARIPFSGRNPQFRTQLTSIKPHILILNKSDLADMSWKHEVEKKLVSEGINAILHTNLQSCNHKDSGLKRILPTALGMVKSSERYNRQDVKDVHLMIIGIPNVGKSTLINRMRSQYGKTSAALVGKSAGVTRHVMERIKVCDDPKIYILDTPGVLEPRIDIKNNVDNMMKLALVSSLSDDIIGPELIADYQLFWLNKNGHFSYVDHFNLSQPSDSIGEVLFQIAVNLNLMEKMKSRSTNRLIDMPSILMAAIRFIRAFRDGSLGKFFLDHKQLGVTPSQQGIPTWKEFQTIRSDLEKPPIERFDHDLVDQESVHQ